MWNNKFISIEGCDGIGKTTLIRNLKQRLTQSGISVVTMAFPDRTTYTGTLINNYLKNRIGVLDPTVVHTIFTANRIESMNRNLISDGVCVLADRYTLSGYIYASIAVNENFAKALQQVEIAACIPVPDIVVILVGRNVHRHTGTEMYENDSFQQSVNNEYLKFNGPNVVSIDVTEMDENTVLETVYEKCNNFFYKISL